MDFLRTKSNDDGSRDEEEKDNPPTPFLTGKHFDIEAYANNYCHRVKILRLVFIADRCGDGNERRRTMQLEALRIAYDQAKKSKDIDLFTKIVKKIKGRLGPNYVMDESWRNSVAKDRHIMSEMLQRCAKNCENAYEQRLVSANDARVLFNSVGNFYHIHGAVTKAYSFYKISERFCKTGQDYAELLWRVIVVAVEMGDFQFVAKIAERGTQDSKLDPIAIQSLRCAQGLAYFKAQRYKDAAYQFLGISKELGNQFSEVLAAHDIAVCGGLCALATFGRTEFQTLIMDNTNFQSYLDVAIQVKELIRDFYLRRYSSCFRLLDNLREWLLLDIYFFNHFETLYDQIRKKALTLYTEPYTTVGLPRVAFVFGTSIEAIEKELTALINTNQIQADIDSVDKVLHLQKFKEMQLFNEFCIVM